MAEIIISLIAICVLIIRIIVLQEFKKNKVRFLVIPLKNNNLLVKFQVCILCFCFTINKNIINNKRILEEIIEHAKKNGFDVSIKFKY